MVVDTEFEHNHRLTLTWLDGWQDDKQVVTEGYVISC